MILFLMTMISLLIEKTKKFIETKVGADEIVLPKTPTPKSFPAIVDDQELKETIYDIIKTIKDPEKPATLEELNVVREEDVYIVETNSNNTKIVRVEFTPTVPHCSLATLIGLCIRVKLQRSLLQKVKIDIFVKEGSHSTDTEINKQVNDKERVAAAMENPNLLKIVENCIKEDE